MPLQDLDFAVVDLETTGWSPRDNGITEIGVVLLRGGKVLGEFAMLVNPRGPIPPGIEELTGISDWMVAAAPPLTEVLPGLLKFIEGHVFIAHNAPFDIGFLTAACEASGLPWPDFTVLDTVLLARAVLEPEEVPDRRLSTLANFFQVPAIPRHRALADARATAGVLQHLLDRLPARDIRTLAELLPWLAEVEAEARAEAQARAAEAKAAAQAQAETEAEGRAASSMTGCVEGEAQTRDEAETQSAA